MKTVEKITNWTFGSFFRTIGRIIGYLVVGILIGALISNKQIKTPKIWEKSVESDIKLSNNEGFYVGSATYSGGANGNYINTSLSNDGYWIIPDTNLTKGSKTLYFKYNGNKNFNENASEYYINIKFSYNRTETSTTTETQYRCNIHNNEETVYNPNGAVIDFENQYDYFTCNQHTSTTTTNSPSYSLTLYYTYGENDYNYIPCNAISNAGDIYSFKCPVGSTDIRGLRISIGTTSTSAYTIGFSPTSRYYIDKEQQIINNQNQMQNTITQDHTYNNNASETIQGQNDLNTYEQAEQGVMNSLDFSAMDNLNIGINPTASSLIWGILERLRNISPKIILLMTSMLGLGLIKMVLNR